MISYERERERALQDSHSEADLDGSFHRLLRFWFRTKYISLIALPFILDKILAFICPASSMKQHLYVKDFFFY